MPARWVLLGDCTSISGKNLVFYSIGRSNGLVVGAVIVRDLVSGVSPLEVAGRLGASPYGGVREIEVAPKTTR